MFIQELLTWDRFDDERLGFLRAIGVDCICLDIRAMHRTDPALDLRDGRDSADFFRAARRKVESHGMRLYSVFMAGWDEITLGRPGRDGKIEAWRAMLRGIGTAGIPVLGYNFKPMGNFRTPSATGRGGAAYSTFDHDHFLRNPPKKRHDPPVSEPEMWGHLEHFLRGVIPAAEEAGVRMALHPDDPPVPAPLGGVAQIASTLEQFRKTFGLVPGDANAMLFCQGCMTERVGLDVYDVIREFASRNWIAYVHFRNVRGKLPRFEEVFIDEGDVDMPRAMRIYKEAGFNGPFMMDHTPHIPDDPGARAGQAYAVGYIRGLIQTVYRTVGAYYNTPLLTPMTNPILDPDMETVKARILEPLLAPVEQARVASALEALRPDGSWPDVDYADQSTVHWKPIDHLQRLLLMARAYRSPESPLWDDPRLREAVFQGLDCWLARDLRRKWWYEAIGVPGVLSQILLLLDEGLTPAQRAKGLEIVGRATLSATGQNLVWMSLIVARRGLLERDPDLVAAAFRRIADEIRISPEEGIQADFSFHQHGPCLYNHGYGAGFATDGAAIALLVAGTGFAFPPEKIALLSAYVLDGSQWMARGAAPEYGAKGREITRARASARYLSQVCRNLLRLPTGREGEFEALLRRTEGDPDAPALEGNRHFWRSDLMVHHRAAWYASARAHSTRNVNTDGLSGCDEGLRSHHLADGCNYLLRTGQEYADIFPVWDWQRVPGATVELGPEQSGEPRRKGTTSFVGGVSDGDFGLFACDFERDGLTARKAWFFFDAAFVCLGAGIACPSDHPVVTTLNQCLLRGDVTVCAEEKTQSPGHGDHVFKQTAWIHHDDIAYIFPEPATIHLRNDVQRGSWKRISLQSSGEEIARDVFKVWVDHGRSPAGAAYAYTVAPGLPPSDVAACASRPGVEILRNDPGLQAVRRPEAGVTGIAFYAPGTLETPDGLRVVVDHACLVLLREHAGSLKASVSNPENGALTVSLSVEWRGKSRTSRFDLPGGPEAGKSVTHTLSD